jgi:hypothetical protein
VYFLTSAAILLNHPLDSLGGFSERQTDGVSWPERMGSIIAEGVPAVVEGK